MPGRGAEHGAWVAAAGPDSCADRLTPVLLPGSSLFSYPHALKKAFSWHAYEPGSPIPRASTGHDLMTLHGQAVYLRTAPDCDAGGSGWQTALCRKAPIHRGWGHW